LLDFLWLRLGEKWRGAAGKKLLDRNGALSLRAAAKGGFCKNFLGNWAAIIPY